MSTNDLLPTGGVVTSETAALYTEDEIATMRLQNIVLGIIWVYLAYFPAAAWYVSRRNGS